MRVSSMAMLAIVLVNVITVFLVTRYHLEVATPWTFRQAILRKGKGDRRLAWDGSSGASDAPADVGPWVTVGSEPKGFSNLLSNTNFLQSCIAVLKPGSGAKSEGDAVAEETGRDRNGGNSGVGLRYPTDARAHFEEIHRRVEKFIPPKKFKHCYDAAKFCGPWLEETWIAEASNRANAYPLGTSFGPFIPLLIPWLAVSIRRRKDYVDLWEVLKSVLRPDVAYMTVTQTDPGLAGGDCEFFSLRNLSNILMLSAGGFGHVPLPLFAQELEPLAPQTRPRDYFVSFLGRVEYGWNIPGNIRPQVSKLVQDRAKHSNRPFFIGKHKNWTQLLGHSQFSLSPRGFGRSSFRTTEIWQLGLIPIYVWDDEEWFPYPSMVARSTQVQGHEIAFSVQPSGLKGLLSNLSNLSSQTPVVLEDMERRIRGLRHSHFTLNGTINQIWALLTGSSLSDLACRPLPACPRIGTCSKRCKK